MTDSRPIRVRFIDHVTIVVRDLDRSRRFYVDALGMEEVPRPSFSFPGLWFQAGPSQVHLILEHAESGPAGNRAPAASSISRTQHFAFAVADALVAAARLKELGIPLAAGPKQRPDGPTQIYVQDPDGHLVELFSIASGGTVRS
jgi:catechol 2,3-dioxygenase-like lactoylglutathione lyase family enzyme